MSKWFGNSIGLPEDKLHKSPEVRAEDFLHLLRQGATRKSHAWWLSLSKPGVEIAAKHPVTTPLAELVDARRGQAPKKRKAIMQTFSAVAYFDAARSPLMKKVF
jgi:hypothetical protein